MNGVRTNANISKWDQLSAGDQQIALEFLCESKNILKPGSFTSKLMNFPLL